MRHLRNSVAVFYLALMFGCAAMPQLTTFEDKAAYAAILIDKVGQTAITRFEQGAISVNQGKEVVRVLKEAQDVLELANTAYKAGNFRDANSSVEYSIAILNEIEKRLKP